MILLVVIISALTKKKILNQEERRESPSIHSAVEQPQIVEYPNSSTTQGMKDISSRNINSDVYSSLLYYVYLDGNTYGPYSLAQLKTYPLFEDTLITTNTLNGTWYEAKYFECLDDLFRSNLPFKIDADGVIIRAAE